jgi:hypothetical protein
MHSLHRRYKAEVHETRNIRRSDDGEGQREGSYNDFRPQWAIKIYWMKLDSDDPIAWIDNAVNFTPHQKPVQIYFYVQLSPLERRHSAPHDQGAGPWHAYWFHCFWY